MEVKMDIKKGAKLSVIMGVLLLLPLIASAEREPLTIACDWDFPPYEYRSNKGKNVGFSVEVLNTILDNLNIPHEFFACSRQQAVDSFLCHKVDLIVDYSQRFSGQPFCRSVNIWGYNQLVLARNRNSQPISSIQQLNGQTIAVNTINDSVPSSMVKLFEGKADLINYTAREALGSLESEKLEYFLWGQAQLEWKIREYNLHNIVLNPLDIEPKEIHLVGYDQELIDDIDNQYARLQQSGKINTIRERWFHPDRAAQHTDPAVKIIVGAIAIIIVFSFIVYRLTIVRIRKVMRRNNDTEAMMRQALNMGNYKVITNNLRKNLITNQHGKAVPDQGITKEQMMEHIHPEDREAMVLRRDVMRKLKGKPYPYRMRWNRGTKEYPDWHTITGFSYPEMGHLPIPKNIVIISRDITDQLKQEQEARELTNRYMKMFDLSVVAMSFYDKDGNLLNLNENMKKLCGLDEESLKYFWTTNLFDTETFKDIAPHSTENFHTCSHMYIPSAGLDKYVEQRLRPIFDENGQLIYYSITARDITYDRNMYLEIQRQRKALNQTNKTNQRYEEELRTLLENSNMFVFHTDADFQRITFSRSFHGEKFIMTFKEYADNMEDDVREEVKRNIDNLIKNAKNLASADNARTPFNITRRFISTPVTHTPAWFAISGLPIVDNKGNVKGLFGVVRNITTLMETQQRLREETARAENSTLLKSTFLANMTHEIRTPLNAIVGFSDLLQAVDNPDDRKEFINIIHNNCDMLMRLINDIFEASNLDVKPLAIVPHRVDFAKEFMLVCQTLQQRVQEPGVEFIYESPEESFVTHIDMGRIQQVITNFVTNAVKYTHQGHIRVGWNYQPVPDSSQTPASSGDQPLGLYIYCEDTGAGIPKEKQERVFDRFVKLNDFVQGTGLGLAISKSIAQGCGGQIGLNSEGDGHGCTFWIWIPCKRDIQA